MTANHVEPQLRLFPGDWAATAVGGATPDESAHPHIKRNKHDAADVEAICEAVVRPTMRFVPVKTAEQQATQLLHRGREQLVRQRTMLVNALRARLWARGISVLDRWWRRHPPRRQGRRYRSRHPTATDGSGDLALPDRDRSMI